MVFLRYVISRDEIFVDSRKVEVMLKWERLINMKKIHSFLELTRYYIRFIKGFSMIATPLT